MYIYSEEAKNEPIHTVFPFSYYSPSAISIDVLPLFSRWHSPQEQRESRMDSKDQP